MCGIVGHIGPCNSVEIVLEGLRRLEYRGYDSAGICFKDNSGKISLYKKTGKLENLKSALSEVECFSHSCIGHTRWATHGGVNDVNAHPHLSDSIAVDHDNSIAIVHNGIIENAPQLRNEISAEGIGFQTETDSEVFLGLLVLELKTLGKTHRIESNEQIAETSFFKAVSAAFKRIKGNSAFVIQIKGTDEIIAVKRGAPLVCGVNSETGEVLVSSDPYALAGVTKEIFFPEDEVVCSLSPDRSALLKFFEFTGESSNRFIAKIQDAAVEISDKGQFEHFMLKEIYEQPGLVRSLAEYYNREEGRKALIEGLRDLSPGRIHIVACGTAWHAGLLAKEYIEKHVQIPCNVELASEFRYRNPLLQENDLGLFISQSGETADTLAAEELCRSKKLKTIAIVNVEGSTLFRNCYKNFLIRAGVEIGVASTKAFTLQALTCRLIGGALQETSDYKKDTELCNLLASRLDKLLSEVGHIQEIAKCIYNHKGFIFTGRGLDFPIALEGALKLKEIAYVHAEGYAAGELKHGPIALIDEDMVNIAIVSDDLYEKTVSNLHEVKARRGVIVVIGPRGDAELEKMSDYYIPMDYEGLENLRPLYTNVATQLLAYYMAKFKGTDIDRPRNLAKSVTVE